MVRQHRERFSKCHFTKRRYGTQEAGEKRGKIKKQLSEMLVSSDMRLVRKFWHSKHEDMFMHFLGDRTKVGNIGSVE